jgi:hypothetical protein
LIGRIDSSQLDFIAEVSYLLIDANYLAKKFTRLLNSVRREVMYNILIEFGIPVKLVRLIKMCLNETCNRVQKSTRLRWAGHVARMGERRGAYRALVGKPEGRRPLGRHGRRWENNIKIDL